MQNPPSAGFGAKCALHPDRTASHTCARCGNFTCDECNATGTETMCPSCRDLAGAGAFPFTRDNHSFDGIWNTTFEKWKQEWVMLSVCVLIFFAVIFGVSLFNQLFTVIARAIVGDRGGTKALVLIFGITAAISQIASTIAQSAFLMGLFRVYIDVLNGRKADVARMMTQFSKIGRYFLQQAAVFLIIGLPVILYLGVLIVVSAALSGISFDDLNHLERDLRPGAIALLIFGSLALIPVLIYVALPLQFATMELVYGDSSPLESIRRAYQLANGHRLSIFGYAFIAGVVAMVGVLACCVGLIPALALGQMLTTGLYLALRNGSGLPVPPEA